MDATNGPAFFCGCLLCAALIRAIVALHDVVQNKIQFKDQDDLGEGLKDKKDKKEEEKEEGKEGEKGGKEKEGEKNGKDKEKSKEAGKKKE